MYPVIADFGFFKINSFGLMMALAFFAASWLVTRELDRRGLEPSHMEGYPLTAMIAGLIGSRLYWVFEHLDKFERAPFATLFGGAGFTWYGGAALGAFAVLFLAHRRNQPLWSVCDAFAPGLAAAYAIGRIGCQLAGDGDYGIPSDVPWAMAYPDAVVPTTERVHPTPVYEMVAMGVATWILWRFRDRSWAEGGALFGLYLILSGVERFLVEFVRTNSVWMLGMTAAQVTSIAAVIAGAWVMRAQPGNQPPPTRAKRRRRARPA